MPSPFIGMNPYMEERAAWAGVHLLILGNVAQQISAQVRPRYRVHVERYMMIGEDINRFRPDLQVKKQADNSPIRPATLTATAAALSTQVLPYQEDKEAPAHLEIVTKEGEIITVIEVLSPINKEGEYKAYLNKRHQLLKAGVNVVELDLLREGQRVPLATEVDSPYVCLISRGAEYPHTHVWKVSWSEALPVLPIPLQADDPDVYLDLAAAIQQAYEVEFEGFIDYSLDPPGALADNWRTEIIDILKTNGLRA
jgi:Protein of unknown function (DUF4058)